MTESATPIYLDYNATTPVDPRVAKAMLPYLQDHFGNPSSGHVYGQATRQAVDRAREHVARLIGCETHELIFTSGGTESNNFAIKGAAMARRSKGNHIITSAIEHPAVTEVCRWLQTQDFDITCLPVDQYGQVSVDDVANAIRPTTTLITVMHSNNEVGTLQPVRSIAALARPHGILVHTDCAQSIGKVPLKVGDLDIDLLSIAGHKLYAPKGVGALYIRDGVTLEKLMHGADHEQNRRAGTENVLEIVGLGEAARLIVEKEADFADHLRTLRDQLEQGLRSRFPDIHINGHPTERLPNTCSVSFPGREANQILDRLTGVAASAGAACHSDGVTVSAVLQAMQVPKEIAMGTLRLSVGRFTTEAEIDRAIEELARILA
ncbi:aminotransferase class V-fold PLP-dependent enzyme [candidate division GN15 bacterium]|nr:aminotransferase class V-fold PLP-dependent enzyme [candidate division GN15 bacterium]